MDESISRLERRGLPVLRQVYSHAFSAAQKSPKVAPTMASEVQHAGVVDTASGIAKTVYAKYEPTAKELLARYEPVAEQYVTSAWHCLNCLPLYPLMARVVVPTTAYCTKVYNQTVCFTAEKGYRVANYLPLVPTEKIARMFMVREAEFWSSDSHCREPAVAVNCAPFCFEFVGDPFSLHWKDVRRR